MSWAEHPMPAELRRRAQRPSHDLVSADRNGTCAASRLTIRPKFRGEGGGALDDLLLGKSALGR